MAGNVLVTFQQIPYFFLKLQLRIVCINKPSCVRIIYRKKLRIYKCKLLISL